MSRPSADRSAARPPATVAAVTSPVTEHQPVRVVVVDADGDVPAVTAVREDGSRWAGAWLVVRCTGAPVAVVEAGFAGADALPADAVRRLVEAAVATSPGRPPAPARPPALPSASVVVRHEAGAERGPDAAATQAGQIDVTIGTLGEEITARVATRVDEIEQDIGVTVDDHIRWNCCELGHRARLAPLVSRFTDLPGSFMEALKRHRRWR